MFDGVPTVALSTIPTVREDFYSVVNEEKLKNVSTAVAAFSKCDDDAISVEKNTSESNCKISRCVLIKCKDKVFC